MTSQPKANSQGKEGEKSNYIWGIIPKIYGKIKRKFKR